MDYESEMQQNELEMDSEPERQPNEFKMDSDLEQQQVEFDMDTEPETQKDEIKTDSDLELQQNEFDMDTELETQLTESEDQADLIEIQQVVDNNQLNSKIIPERRAYLIQSMDKPEAKDTQQESITLTKVKLEQLLDEPAPSWQPHMLPRRTQPLTKDILNLLRQNIKPARPVVSVDKKFYCHNLLLSLISSYFHKPIKQILQLDSLKISSRAFASIYRWLLKPLSLITLSHLAELLQASQFLDIEELNSQCWEVAYKVLKSADRILAMYCFLGKNSPSMEKILLPYLGRVLLPFAGSQEFAQLTFRKVRRLLFLENLSVNTEIEILYTAILWLAFDWTRRKHYAIDLIQAVRWDMLPFLFLITFDRRTDGPPALGYLTQSIQVRQLIHEALKEVHDKSDRYQGAIGICTRNWIYDTSCPYHHVQSCKKIRYVSYSQFLNYINWLQNVGYSRSEQVQDYAVPGIECCSGCKPEYLCRL